MNKPLTSAQRVLMPILHATCASVANDKDANAEIVGALIAGLLSAEAYWREAVKNHPGAVGDENVCDFCDVSLDTRNHKPECAWLIAQEEV